MCLGLGINVKMTLIWKILQEQQNEIQSSQRSIWTRHIPTDWSNGIFSINVDVAKWLDHDWMFQTSSKYCWQKKHTHNFLFTLFAMSFSCIDTEYRVFHNIMNSCMYFLFRSTFIAFIGTKALHTFTLNLGICNMYRSDARF